MNNYAPTNYKKWGNFINITNKAKISHKTPVTPVLSLFPDTGKKEKLAPKNQSKTNKKTN
jgi:hypothetical protein